jgi:hypothetical protein
MGQNIQKLRNLHQIFFFKFWPLMINGWHNKNIVRRENITNYIGSEFVASEQPVSHWGSHRPNHIPVQKGISPPFLPLICRSSVAVKIIHFCIFFHFDSRLFLFYFIFFLGLLPYRQHVTMAFFTIPFSFLQSPGALGNPQGLTSNCTSVSVHRNPLTHSWTQVPCMAQCKRHKEQRTRSREGRTQ